MPVGSGYFYTETALCNDEGTCIPFNKFSREELQRACLGLRAQFETAREDTADAIKQREILRKESNISVRTLREGLHETGVAIAEGVQEQERIKGTFEMAQLLNDRKMNSRYSNQPDNCAAQMNVLRPSKP